MKNKTTQDNEYKNFCIRVQRDFPYIFNLFAREHYFKLEDGSDQDKKRKGFSIGVFIQTTNLVVNHSEYVYSKKSAYITKSGLHHKTRIKTDLDYYNYVYNIIAENEELILLKLL